MTSLHSFEKHLPEIASGVYLAPGSHLVGRVSIGERSSVWFNAVLRADLETITIGMETNIQDNATIHVDAGSPAWIGDRVVVGHNAVIHGATIEDGALIGMGAVVLNGARVGRDSIVGAGSLVTGGTVIPPRSLVLGSPGKVASTLEEGNIPVQTGAYRYYLDLARIYLSGDGSGA